MSKPIIPYPLGVRDGSGGRAYRRGQFKGKRAAQPAEPIATDSPTSRYSPASQKRDGGTGCTAK